MPDKNMQRIPNEHAAFMLKACLNIGKVGSVVAVALFVFSVAIDYIGKWPVISGILAVFTIIYTILSRRAYQIVASGKIPVMRNLVILTLFNLIVLGLPVGGLGFLALLFGTGILQDGPIEGLALTILGVCAVLFFVSHIMTLAAAVKLR